MWLEAMLPVARLEYFYPLKALHGLYMLGT